MAFNSAMCNTAIRFITVVWNVVHSNSFGVLFVVVNGDQCQWYGATGGHL